MGKQWHVSNKRRGFEITEFTVEKTVEKRVSPATNTVQVFCSVATSLVIIVKVICSLLSLSSCLPWLSCELSCSSMRSTCFTKLTVFCPGFKWNYSISCARVIVSSLKERTASNVRNREDSEAQTKRAKALRLDCG